MNPDPCPTCGYARAAGRCEHCESRPRAAALGARPARGLAGVGIGLRALPTGLAILARTRGAALLLLPPVFLTVAAFGGLFWWIWSELGALATAVREADASGLEGWPDWIRGAVEHALASGWLGWLGGLGHVLVFALAALLVVALGFSVVYELICGPFLDELQGRIESKWFGLDPRDRTQRPNDIPSGRAAALTLLWALPAGAGAIAAPVGYERVGAAGVGVALFALTFASRLDRRYGAWLRWAVRTEGGTLWVSLRAALVTLLIVVAFLWLYLVPVVGAPLFFLLTGFVTAIGLLDIPFSRRRWGLSQELAFSRRHALALTAYGSVAALVFAVPVIGPLLMLPSASIGGLWLVCRLDKEGLRAD